MPGKSQVELDREAAIKRGEQRRAAAGNRLSPPPATKAEAITAKQMFDLNPLTRMARKSAGK